MLTNFRLGPALSLGLLVSLILGMSPALGQEQEAESSIEDPNATVYVDGIACPFCAYGLEKKLKNLDAIQRMEVQLEEGRVLLAFKEGESATKEDIQAAVENAGFSARKIEFAGESPSGDVSP